MQNPNTQLKSQFDMRQSGVLSALSYLTEQALIRPLDLEFARFLWSQEIKHNSNLASAEASQRAELCAKYGALVSVYLGKGHVCVQLESLISGPTHPFLDTEKTSYRQLASLDQDLLSLLAFNIDELPLLADCISVSYEPIKPLMLEKSQQGQVTRMYLNRYWHYEEGIAKFVRKGQSIKVDDVALANILDGLFPSTADGSVDYQKLAAAVALTTSMSVITGGPGTGKTYTVVRILAALIQYHHAQVADENADKLPVIKLAAPTGKAAARMLESIRGAVDTLPLDETQKAAFPDSASTLHRLLGPKPLDANFKHNQKNPLHLDILIVDEASMIDLPMMAKLLDAMPGHGRLVLLGDRDQLASVEAGAVLNDLCQSLGAYSKARAEQLQRLTGFSVDMSVDAKPYGMQDSLAWLRVSRRFGEHSGIGHLAKAINDGLAHKVNSVLHDASFSDVESIEYSQAEYSVLLTDIAKAYQSYISFAKQQSYEDALTAFSEVRLLCALREGDFGVNGLNKAIEDRLSNYGVIDRLVETDAGVMQSDWYIGRPVMVTRNDHALGLYNGDIGVVMTDAEHRLRVYFDSAEGLKAVLPSRMPEHETAYAMTVHKSQGSEFDHTYFVLPDRLNPVLTRELVYTGVTRAKTKLTMMYEPQVLSDAVAQRVQRFSGLQEKLKY
ncbi:exodeoxyribonuclease V subunit alpha [Litoribrevibacter albus]|uniref:RecBCD enzyme subunit RecD n=1 Tax=Litoribrevibacter albus TaxID=1473156 RepID=A0AA37W6P3_9GAMM|nr:exodeoxyribonuclease V subunit alpha [Litoribrevibacter albus]GLQ31765.1 RecBCD enzyme subunit RecD [Litoribrevibacter albus]